MLQIFKKSLRKTLILIKTKKKGICRKYKINTEKDRIKVYQATTTNLA